MPNAQTVARYVIDAPTLLHVVDSGLTVDPEHQLVAPNSILAIARLQADALVTVDRELAARAENVVPLVALQSLLCAE